MPTKKNPLSDSLKSIFAILNNIDELIVKSQDRKNAKEVMSALTIFAKNKNIKVPEDKINNFHAILLDSRPYTLSYIIKDIASDILKNNR